MRLDVSEIIREVGKHADYDIHEPPLVQEDLECMRPLRGKISFTNAGDALIVQGKIATSLALACSRCTEYFEYPVVIAVDEQFEIRTTGAGPRSRQTFSVVEEDESPIAQTLFDGHVMDLTEMLRQLLYLEEPTQPLPPCDKAGFCTHCRKHPADVLKALMGEEEDENAFPSPLSAQLNRVLPKEDADLG